MDVVVLWSCTDTHTDCPHPIPTEETTEPSLCLAPAPSESLVLETLSVSLVLVGIVHIAKPFNILSLVLVLIS